MIDSVSSVIFSAFARLLTLRSYTLDRTLMMMGAGMSVTVVPSERSQAIATVASTHVFVISV
jgi:hypothetical protein